MECILCKGKNFEPLISVDGFEIKKCKKCGLVRTFGEQTVDYQEYHRDDDYLLHEKLFKNIFQKRFDTVTRFHPEPGKIIDIGAATGSMLDLFSVAGWETWGVEPSKSGAIAKKKGHKIVKGILEKVKLPKNYFDVAIINHTLEHVDDPVKVLAKIKTVLKKGGFVYVDVPNFGSLSAQVLNKNWRLLAPNEHIHQFNPKILKKIVKKAGLKVDWWDTWSGVYDVGNLYKHFWIQLTSKKAHMYKNFVFDVLGIPGNILATSINKGTSLAVVGKKR